MPAESGEGLRPGAKLLVLPSRGRRGRRLSGASFVRALIPIVRVDPRLLPSPLNAITFGSENFNTRIWGGHKHSLHLTWQLRQADK